MVNDLPLMYQQTPFSAPGKKYHILSYRKAPCQRWCTSDMEDIPAAQDIPGAVSVSGNAYSAAADAHVSREHPCQLCFAGTLDSHQFDKLTLRYPKMKPVQLCSFLSCDQVSDREIFLLHAAPPAFV